VLLLVVGIVVVGAVDDDENDNFYSALTQLILSRLDKKHITCQRNALSK